MNSPLSIPAYTAFSGETAVLSGSLSEVVSHAKTQYDATPAAEILVFDNLTGRTLDIDYRGTADDVSQWVRAVYGERLRPAAEAEDEPRGPGRPKLGVVAREVTLLPRHWEWLATQSGGASAALRRLVDDARRTHADRDRQRQSQEACYRFINTLAGDRQNYEEANRALFAGDRERFAAMIQTWPQDIHAHALLLASAAFEASPSSITH